MANIYINKDAIYFTAPSSITTSFSKLSNQGYAVTSFRIEWMGVNLGYTEGYILPTSGTLTYVSASKLDGTSLYSADGFSLNLATLPALWSVDDVIFNRVGNNESNNIIGSINNDFLIGKAGDFVNGGLGQDTLILFSPSSSYSISDVAASSSSGKITALNNSSYINFISVEKITFSDKTVNVSDYIQNLPTTKTYTLSIIVDKNIIGVNAVLLSNLIETQTYSGSNLISHTIKYGNSTFNFSDIDSIVTTVVRDGSFTAEFQKEIAELAPSAANITYKDAVSLVGVSNVVDTLIYVAGADGNFVS